MAEAWTHREAVVGGVRLHYVEAGEGPLIVLLHGFPECWYSWRYQIPALAAAGYRVVAPDMRGYNTSEKPPGVESYRLTCLTDDVAGLVAHCGEEQATIVGHDWGGVVTWAMPVFRPDVTARVAILNAPHPRAMLRELRTPAQALRSWYMFAFQLPGVPEALLAAGSHAAIAAIARLSGRGAGEVSADDVRVYTAAAAQPGALTGMVSYYRAALRAGLGLSRPDAAIRDAVLGTRIDVPALLVWGEADPVLGVRLTEGLAEWVPDLTIARIPGAGHTVQVEAYEAVNRELLSFLGARAETPVPEGV